MRNRLRPLIMTLAVTGALAGGGAAIANAASSSTTSSTTGTTTTTAPSSQAPAQGQHAPRSANGAHPCPNM